MGDTTHISWADATFNPWIGCTKVSPACDGCYAEHLMQNRMGRAQWGGPGKGVGTRERTAPANWRKPLAWDRQAAKDGTRPFVFCSSLADVFDNAVDREWRRDLFDLIRATPHLTWLLLTKRPQNILKLYCEATGQLFDRHGIIDPREWPANAAIGCTVVTQEEADRDVPVLLTAKRRLKPAFAFLSMEPLMGPVALDKLPWRFNAFGAHPSAAVKSVNALTGQVSSWDRSFPVRPDEIAPSLDWVITGGETDQGAHKARPSHPHWFRDLRDQCAAAGVAFHHKQNGEWVGPNTHVPPNTNPREVRHDLGATPVFRVGKALAGRFLDGTTHDARPAFRSAS